MSNDFALSKTRDFTNLFKSDAVGPCCPNNPVRRVLRWFRFFDSGNWVVGLLWIHGVLIRLFGPIR